MRFISPWTLRVAAGAAVVTALSACGSDSETGGPGGAPSATSSAQSTTVAPPACNGLGPDGYCNAFGSAPETCECADCKDSAQCKQACVDNAACDLDGGEDCTCADCFGKVAECPPFSVGCSDEAGECGVGEDCVCPNCTNTPRCTDACNDNGSCVPYLEGCSCADCAGHDACGGNSGGAPGTGSTTTSAGGTGGDGGSGGVTAMGGSSSTGVGVGGSGGN